MSSNMAQSVSNSANDVLVRMIDLEDAYSKLLATNDRLVIENKMLKIMAGE